jgi:hypothetical protein
MRLPLVGRKKKSKKQQTLDTVASVAKAWGEWQLAKGAVKTAKGVPWKLVGVVTAGAAAVTLGAKKLLGGGKSSSADTPFSPSAPAYTGPVPDPNAPGAGDTGTVGASPAAPVAPSATPDPEAPKTPDK